MQYLIQIDRQLFKRAYQGRFIHIFPVKWLIFMGDGPFWMIVVFIAALTGQLLNMVSFSEAAVRLMLGLSVGQVVFALLKTKVRRRRPYANLELHQKLQIEIQNRDPVELSLLLHYLLPRLFWTLFVFIKNKPST